MVAAVATAVAGASLWMEWLSAKAGPYDRRYTALTLPGLRFLLPALALATVGCAVLHRIRTDVPDWLPWFFLAVACALPMVFLALSESAAALLPTFFVPEAVRDVAVGMQAGLGAWAFLAALTVVVVAGQISGRGFDRAPLGSLSLAGYAGLSLSLCGFVLIRYAPWIEVADVEDMQGYALPAIGPLSSAAIAAIGAGLALAVVLRRPTPTLVAAFAGWLVGLAATIVLLAASLFAHVPINRLLARASVQHHVEARAGLGPWLAVGFAFLTSLSAAALWLEVPRPDRHRR